MEAVFLKIINMSINAGWLILAVILLRLLLKKAPKWVMGVLWGFVAIRLTVPFSLESIFSLIPSGEPIPQTIFTAESPAINSGFSVINETVNPILSDSLAPHIGDSVSPVQTLLFIAAVVWVIGIAGMLLYALISYLRIHRRVREATPLKENIWICDRIATPFILGIFRPRICLPSAMEEGDTELVIAHERAHLKRKDHIWKPLGFLLLAVYWFNPLLWAAYILLCRDIELACDEKVLKELGSEMKKPYSNALINFSAPRKRISACPLCFGETGVQERVKGVLSYKKPAFWLILAAVILCIVTAVCLLTNPKTYHAGNLDDNLKLLLDTEIMEHHRSDQTDGNFIALDYEVLKVDRSHSDTTLYLWVLYQEYKLENGELKEEAGAHIPTVITATRRIEKNKNGLIHYDLKEYWTPRDGSYYEGDIKEKFPMTLWAQAFDSTRFAEKQIAKCTQIAKEHFNIKNETNISDTTQTGSDEWGVSMDVNWTSYTSFDIVLTHNAGNSAPIDELETSDEYEIRGKLPNGETVALGDYIRSRSNPYYSDPALSWEQVLWSIKPGGTFTQNCSLAHTYGRLPDGSYVLCKTVTIVTENGEKIPKVYTVSFEMPSAFRGGYNPYFNAEVLAVDENSILVKPDADSAEIKSSDKISVSLNLISKIPVPELKVGDRVRVVYNGAIAESYPAQINGAFAVYALNENGEAIIPTPQK